MKAAVALLLMACSSSGAETSDAAAAAGAGDAFVQADTAGACTALVQVGEVVVPKIAADSAMAPPPNGGTMTPGVYVLSEIILYQVAGCRLLSALTTPV